MKILQEYKTHHYFSNYDKSEFFCPNCGKKEVWEEQGAGDYYVGVNFTCISCKHEFNLPFFRLLKNDNDEMELKIIEQIKSGITNIPISKPGN